MSTYLELYLELLKTLPNEFSREMTLITLLDQKADDISTSLETLTAKITEMSAKRRLNSEDQTMMEKLLTERRNKEMEMYNLTKEKIDTVDQIHNVLRSYVGKIDEDLSKFKRELDPQVCSRGKTVESRRGRFIMLLFDIPHLFLIFPLLFFYSHRLFERLMKKIIILQPLKLLTV